MLYGSAYQKVRDNDIEMSAVNEFSKTSIPTSASDVALPTNAFKSRWRIASGFQIILTAWLVILSVLYVRPLVHNTHMVDKIAASTATNDTSTITLLPNGKVALDIYGVDEVRFIKPVHFRIVESIGSVNATVWSPAILKVCAEDSVMWQFQSAANVVTCNNERNISATYATDELYSGTVGSTTSFKHKFSTPGTYYFCSQSGPSLFGVISVHPQPSYSVRRDSALTGATPVIPSGVQLNLTSGAIAAMDGCWAVCYQGLFAATAFSFQSAVVERCGVGDWLFMGVATARDSSLFTVGAFGEKNVVFSSPTVFDSRKNTTVHTVRSNGAYWWRIDSPQYGFHSIGVSSAITPRADWEHQQQVYCKSMAAAPDCKACLSWGSAYGSAGCGSYIEEPSHYRVIMTNTCPLRIVPL